MIKAIFLFNYTPDGGNVKLYIEGVYLARVCIKTFEKYLDAFTGEGTLSAGSAWQSEQTGYLIKYNTYYITIERIKKIAACLDELTLAHLCPALNY